MTQAALVMFQLLTYFYKAAWSGTAAWLRRNRWHSKDTILPRHIIKLLVLLFKSFKNIPFLINQSINIIKYIFSITKSFGNRIPIFKHISDAKFHAKCQ